VAPPIRMASQHPGTNVTIGKYFGNMFRIYVSVVIASALVTINRVFKAQWQFWQLVWNSNRLLLSQPESV
jgi:hypothetical protein